MRLLVSAALLSLFVASSLVACSHPPQSLHDKGQSRTFNVQLPSDSVYRKVVDGARGCYTKWEIAADYFLDNKSGRVSMSVKDSFGTSSLFKAEISPTDGGTAVQVLHLQGHPVFSEAVEAWTQGNYAFCPFTV